MKTGDAHIHAFFMRRCLDLAAKGLGKTLSNPLVGAAVVYEGRILGEGYHEKFGGPHAEVNALQQVKEKHLLPSSVLYVTLEPCNHHGKTPPCTDNIITSGIRKVVIAMRDPNPQVAGKGVQAMASHGIEVIENILEEEAKTLNKRFLCFHEFKRPFVLLKWATSADGCIAGANGKTVQITGEKSRILVHKWRSEEMSILVGCRTVLADNPRLTVRSWQGKQPLRIAIDPEGRIPSNHDFFKKIDAPFLLVTKFNTHCLPPENVLLISSMENMLQELLAELYSRQILSVMVEGGAFTLTKFIEAGLWDEARIGMNANLALNEGIPAPEIHGELSETFDCGNDNWTIVHRSKQALNASN